MWYCFRLLPSNTAGGRPSARGRDVGTLLEGGRARGAVMWVTEKEEITRKEIIDPLVPKDMSRLVFL